MAPCPEGHARPCITTTAPPLPPCDAGRMQCQGIFRNHSAAFSCPMIQTTTITRLVDGEAGDGCHHLAVAMSRSKRRRRRRPSYGTRCLPCGVVATVQTSTRTFGHRDEPEVLPLPAGGRLRDSIPGRPPLPGAAGSRQRRVPALLPPALRHIGGQDWKRRDGGRHRRVTATATGQRLGGDGRRTELPRPASLRRAGMM